MFAKSALLCQMKVHLKHLQIVFWQMQVSSVPESNSFFLHERELEPGREGVVVIASGISSCFSVKICNISAATTSQSVIDRDNIVLEHLLGLTTTLMTDRL